MLVSLSQDPWAWIVPAVLSLYVLGYLLVMSGAYGLVALILRDLPKGVVQDMTRLGLLLKVRRLRLYAFCWPLTVILVAKDWTLAKLGLKSESNSE